MSLVVKICFTLNFNILYDISKIIKTSITESTSCSVGYSFSEIQSEVLTKIKN